MSKKRMFCDYEFAFGERIDRIYKTDNGEAAFIDDPLEEHLALALIELDSRIDDGKMLSSMEAIIRASAIEGLKQLGYDRIYINGKEQTV